MMIIIKVLSCDDYYQGTVFQTVIPVAYTPRTVSWVTTASLSTALQADRRLRQTTQTTGYKHFLITSTLFQGHHQGGVASVNGIVSSVIVTDVGFISCLSP